MSLYAELIQPATAPFAETAATADHCSCNSSRQQPLKLLQPLTPAAPAAAAAAVTTAVPATVPRTACSGYHAPAAIPPGAPTPREIDAYTRIF